MWMVGLTCWYKLSLSEPVVLTYSVIIQMNTMQLYPQAQQNTRTDLKT